MREGVIGWIGRPLNAPVTVVTTIVTLHIAVNFVKLALLACECLPGVT